MNLETDTYECPCCKGDRVLVVSEWDSKNHVVHVQYFNCTHCMGKGRIPYVTIPHNAVKEDARD